MKGLLVKDFLMLKNQNRFLILALIMIIVISWSGSGSTFAIGYCAFMGVLNGISTISYDEYNHGYRFLFTLPFTRREYVLEKYLFTILCTVVFSLVGGGITMILQMTQAQPAFTLLELGMMVLVLFGMALLITAIMLPVQLRFGAEKGRIAYVLVMLILFVIVIGGVKLLEIWHFPPADFALSLSIPMLGAGAALMIITALLISYGVSLAVLGRKEF